jgi:hypothetical protein
MFQVGGITNQIVVTSDVYVYILLGIVTRSQPQLVSIYGEAYCVIGKPHIQVI